jgi:hypothetical protein
LNVRDYYRSTELCRIRQFMRYRLEDYWQDWELAIALAQLLSIEETEARHRLLEATFNRILAYQANNPDAPFRKPL